MRLFYFYLAVFLVLFVIFVFVSRIDAISIKNIVVIGNSVEKREDLESFVRDRIVGYYLFFIPKSNIFLYPKNTIERELKEQYKKIKDADLSFGNFNEIILEVKDRKPKFIWCPDSSSDCYFSDESGFIFTLAPDLSEDLYLRVSGGLSGDALGQTFSIYWPISRFLNFIESVEAFNLDVVGFEIKGEGEIVINISHDRSLLINEKENLERILLNLESVLLSDVFKDTNFDFEYIDLRLDNKIFYKLRRP